MEQQQLEQQQLVDCDETPEALRLEMDAIIGFNGEVKAGLKFHPDRQHIIYPLGCAVVVESVCGNEKPRQLWGHTDYVTCIAISNKGGELIASGQKTYMGFKAVAIVWEFQSMRPVYKLELHKVNIQALVFSPNDLYLASLGGCDDGSVVIWGMSNGEAICGAPAQVESAGNTLCISFSLTRDDVFVTGGDSTLRVWELDVKNRKIRPSEVDMGQIKRKVECIQMTDGPFFFCGTSTGDILAINMKTKRFQFKAPEKHNFEKGVTALAHLVNYNFLVGTGCGKLYELKFPLPTDGKKPAKPKEVRSWQDETVKSTVDKSITSIALRGSGHQFYVGTANSRMYKFGYESKCDVAKFDTCELVKTCHSSQVNDIVFPSKSSTLFTTCQKEQIRVWAFCKNGVKEVKRYVIPNMNCNAIALTCEGKAIVSAWDDGIIRVLGFNANDHNNIVSKKAITAAHHKGVTAIACTKNEPSYDGVSWNFTIVSGGGEGQVRIWSFHYNGRDDPSYNLIDTLKEHKGSVSDIKMKNDDSECVSASTDGTCIVWNLKKRVRSQVVFANTLFKSVFYNLRENQIVTSGTDRKVSYWEICDGSPIREVLGAKTGAVNSMDISCNGDYFVTGGEDKLLKVWNYEQADVVAVGIGHSATITRVKICPNMKKIISVGKDGGILIWKFPF